MKIKNYEEAQQQYQNVITEMNNQYIGLAELMLKNRLTNETPFDLFYKMKFTKFLKDSISNKEQNFLEAINQNFTYLVTFKALMKLYSESTVSSSEEFLVNLGSQNGSDIQTTSNSLFAEVFTANRPSQNSKLSKDIDKVVREANKAGGGSSQYVFFYSPNIEEGPYRNCKKLEEVNFKHVEVYSIKF